ncbi:hypothetical protein HDU79_007492 [Rhizoclosmatium sp. JEL0117]|nr:hypothetical protein HDU79_007492 [Rhizoclosmatium sp. JEL0117]
MRLTAILATILLALASSTALAESINEVSADAQGPKDCSHMFIPTTDWKVIHPDECIPAGLHIRINFDTGLKEAKLKNPNDDAVDANAAVAIVHQGEDGELKVTNPNEAKPEEKQSLLAEGLGVDDLVHHLTWLEEEVSDIDEGANLMEDSWLRARLVGLLASHEDAGVRSHAARVFAGAVSNNFNAQRAAVAEVDGILAAVSHETNVQVRKSLAHAVASLVRGNKVAARVFWRHNGFKALKHLYDVSKVDRRVQNKVKELVNDLFDVDMLAEGSEVDEEGLVLMKDGGFCDGSVSDEGITSLCTKAAEVASRKTEL